MHSKADILLQKEKEALSSFDNKTRKFSEEREAKKRQIKDNELQKTRVEEELKLFGAEKKEMSMRLKDSMKKNPWIQDKEYVIFDTYS
jgi:chromosome segregation ATPase